MGIEDRLRDDLRRSAAEVDDEGAPLEHLWEGIERGVRRRRRREAGIRVATAVVVLSVVAGAVAWLVIAFARPGPEPADRRPALSVQDVRVYGVPSRAVKIYGRVSNRGSRAVGAAVTCTVLDASANVLGTAIGSVPFIRVGASEAFGPLTGQYRSLPSSARCRATRIAAVAPSPSPVVRPVLQPGLVAFWDPRHGILAGALGSSSCDPSCLGVIDVTDDGGRTWRTVRREGNVIHDLSVLPPPNLSGCGFGCGVPAGRGTWAWALSGPCAMGTCDIGVLFSGDGGRTWALRSTGDLKKVSFVSATEGWGVGNLFPTGSQKLDRTSDGGRTWRTGPVPCPRAAAVASDVSFVSPAHGWLLCTGPGAAGNEDRAILETTNGGRTWNTVARAELGGPAAGSGLTVSGYPTGIFFLPDGHGWMWADRGVGVQMTTDGGRSWRVVGTIPNGASTSMRSVWFASDTTGFALLANGDGQATQLIETLDGGGTWRVIHSWSA